MAHLSDEQVATVQERISSAGHLQRDLLNGLLDHYCCFIEQEMDKGREFEAAYELAFVAITPNGAEEIQEELFFLMTIHKQINMKRIIYGSGFVTAFSISMGLLSRTMHWPQASIFMIIGFSALIISSGAILVNFAKFVTSHSLVYTLRVFTGFFAALLIATGSIFKELHFPLANFLILCGMVLLNFIFIPMLFWFLYQYSVKKGG